MYVINNWRQLRQFSHIIWDIDGTITERDVLSEDVMFKITILAQRYGVYHSFITGRDAKWIIEKLIEPMSGFYNFARVRDIENLKIQPLLLWHLYRPEFGFLL